MERLLVTIATYNEIGNLPRLVDEIFLHTPEVDILVIDDESPDGTGSWCDEAAKDETRLYCLHREHKMGLGTAIIAGMKYAVDRDYKYVLNIDADFSHSPRDIRNLLAGMEANKSAPVDVMIGSRYVYGGKIEGWPLKRHLMSRAVNLYARCLLTLKPKDCSGGFRCYRTSKIAELDFGRFRSLGYAFQEEVLWRLKKRGARIGETPITFVDRETGQSKIDSHEVWEALCIIFQLGVRNWAGKKE